MQTTLQYEQWVNAFIISSIAVLATLVLNSHYTRDPLGYNTIHEVLYTPLPVMWPMNPWQLDMHAGPDFIFAKCTSFFFKPSCASFYHYQRASWQIGEEVHVLCLTSVTWRGERKELMNM